VIPLGAESAPPPASQGSRAVRTVRVVQAPLADRPTALAFVDEARLLLLTADEVALVRLDGASLSILSRLALSGPRRAARASAGLIFFDHDSSTAWVLTNHRARAHLVDLGGDRVTERAEAEAFPWPGSSTGLRFREGTTWIEGEVEGVGSGPFLALARDAGAVAVSTDARLLSSFAVPGSASEGEDDRPLVGPTLATPWPGWLAASTAAPPGASDRLLLLESSSGRFAEAAAIEVEGAIRAVASRGAGATARLALVTERAGRFRLVFLDLERRAP
jgi:hypothetical protein